MAFTENPLAFFGDFGVDATLNAGAVRGILVAPYGEAFGLVAGSRPVFMLASSVSAARGDVLAIAGNSYEVAEIQADGTAIKSLVLEDI